MSAGTAPAETRCGFVALVGAPNAGKSTLLNALVGAKVSIVSRKVQTTRTRIRGVGTEGAVQIVFVDTPGVFAPRRRLDRAMVAAAWSAVDDADARALVVDAAALDAAARPGGKPAARRAAEETGRLVEALAARSLRPTLLLNKIDRLDRKRLLPLAADLAGRLDAPATFFVSAAKGDGVADVRAHFAAAMPESPWLFEADRLTDLPDRLAAAEITREQVFDRLHQELPYGATVETDVWSKARGGGFRIEQTIYVSRDAHRPIVIGAGGATLKAIGAAARAEIARVFETPVHLFLRVAVRPGWTDESERYAAMGLDMVD